MELAEPATTFVNLGDNCRLASFDGALRSLGAGRPWAGVMAEFAGADWLVGAVCGLCLFACWTSFSFGRHPKQDFRPIDRLPRRRRPVQIEAGLPPHSFLSSTHSPTPVDPVSPFRVEPPSSH